MSSEIPSFILTHVHVQSWLAHQSGHPNCPILHKADQPFGKRQTFTSQRTHRKLLTHTCTRQSSTSPTSFRLFQATEKHASDSHWGCSPAHRPSASVLLLLLLLSLGCFTSLQHATELDQLGQFYMLPH